MKLDPQAQRLLDKIEAAGIPAYETLSPAQARELYEKACQSARGKPPELLSVRDTTIPGPATDLDAVVYRNSDESNLPVLVYFHGGGFTIGSTATHDAVCRTLCMIAECIVISVGYRLAPENPYPAALDDAMAATCWVAENTGSLGADPSRIAVGGDSAGGNLAAVVCLLAKQQQFPDLAFQLLIYPATDLTESFPSHEKFGQGYLLTASLINWFHGNYLGQKSDPAHWLVSPLYAREFQGLPPACIVTAGFDPLQDEGRAYGENLERAGIPVCYRHYPGMLHGFFTQPGYIDQARKALQDCGQILRKTFAG